MITTYDSSAHREGPNSLRFRLWGSYRYLLVLRGALLFPSLVMMGSISPR